VIEEARQAEVDDPGLPVRADDDVARLEVAMDDAAGVGVRDPLRGLPEDVDQRLERERAAADELAQVGPLHVLHAEERDAVDLPAVVDRDDVRVLELRDRLGLAGEVRRDPDAQDLDRHRPLELGVEGLVDGPDPAPADLLEELVPAEPAGRLRGGLEELVEQLEAPAFREGAARGAELAQLPREVLAHGVAEAGHGPRIELGFFHFGLATEAQRHRVDP